MRRYLPIWLDDVQVRCKLWATATNRRQSPALLMAADDLVSFQGPDSVLALTAQIYDSGHSLPMAPVDRLLSKWKSEPIKEGPGL
jgi:hypothetical protein